MKMSWQITEIGSFWGCPNTSLPLTLSNTGAKQTGVQTRQYTIEKLFKIQPESSSQILVLLEVETILCVQRLFNFTLALPFSFNDSIYEPCPKNMCIKRLIGTQKYASQVHFVITKFSKNMTMWIQEQA